MGDANPKSFYMKVGKRVLDLVYACIGMVLLSPLLLVVALVLVLKQGPPVFFRQARPGVRGVPFEIVKFRTMIEAKDACGTRLADDTRLTAVGRMLRRTSLDELPELINVLKGDMSIVGPRPLLMQYLPLYSVEQKRRHEVRPGITGWAQIHGRNAVSWDERFRMDIWYVDHVSLGLDLKIILRTIVKALRGEGVSAEGHATMPEFRGSGSGEC